LRFRLKTSRRWPGNARRMSPQQLCRRRLGTSLAWLQRRGGSRLKKGAGGRGKDGRKEKWSERHEMCHGKDGLHGAMKQEKADRAADATSSNNPQAPIPLKCFHEHMSAPKPQKQKGRSAAAARSCILETNAQSQIIRRSAYDCAIVQSSSECYNFSLLFIHRICDCSVVFRMLQFFPPLHPPESATGMPAQQQCPCLHYSHPSLAPCHCHMPRSSCRQRRCVQPQRSWMNATRAERPDVMLAAFVGFVAMQSQEPRDRGLAFCS
jgi:hypothetical protein